MHRIACKRCLKYLKNIRTIVYMSRERMRLIFTSSSFWEIVMTSALSVHKDFSLYDKAFNYYALHSIKCTLSVITDVSSTPVSMDSSECQERSQTSVVFWNFLRAHWWMPANQYDFSPILRNCTTTFQKKVTYTAIGGCSFQLCQSFNRTMAKRRDWNLKFSWEQATLRNVVEDDAHFGFGSQKSLRRGFDS